MRQRRRASSESPRQRGRHVRLRPPSAPSTRTAGRSVASRHGAAQEGSHRGRRPASRRFIARHPGAVHPRAGRTHGRPPRSPPAGWEHWEVSLARPGRRPSFPALRAAVEFPAAARELSGGRRRDAVPALSRSNGGHSGAARTNPVRVWVRIRPFRTPRSRGANAVRVWARMRPFRAPRCGPAPPTTSPARRSNVTGNPTARRRLPQPRSSSGRQAAGPVNENEPPGGAARNEEPAATYSPRPVKAKYHRRCGA